MKKNIFILILLLLSLILLGLTYRYYLIQKNSKSDMINSFFQDYPLRDIPPTADFGAYTSAITARLDNNYPKACEYFEKAYQSDPENDELLYQTFMYAVLSGQMEKAFEYVPLVYAKNPKEVLPVFILFIKNIQEGKNNLNVSLLNTVPKNPTFSFIKPLLMAWMDVSEGKYDSALKKIEFLQKDPAFFELYSMNKAFILEIKGDIPATKLIYDRLLETSIGKSTRILILVKDFYTRHRLPIPISLQQEYFKNQESSFMAKEMMALSKEVGRVDDFKKGIAVLFFDLSMALSNQEDSEISIFLVQIASYLHPKDVLIKIFLTELLEKKNAYEHANMIYDSHHLGDDMFFSFSLQSIQNDIRMENYEQAEQKLIQIIDIDDTKPLFYLMLGDVYLFKKNYKKSITAYEKTLSFFKDPMMKDLGRVYFSLASAYWMDEDISSAETYIKKALLINPDDANYLNFLGYIYLEEEQNLTEACQMIEKAFSILPEDVQIMDSQGYCYYKNKRYDDARQLLEKAINIDPLNAVINDHLGDLYWASGRRNEAVFKWKKALNLKQDLSARKIEKIQRKIDDAQ